MAKTEEKKEVKKGKMHKPISENLTKDKSKEIKDLVKGSDRFKNAIIDHLKDTARKDPLFLNTLKKKNKSINSCIAYILTTVQKSGMQGFEDDEVYKMARHYYDEDDIKVVPFTSEGMIVMNQQIALTEEEIAQAKAEAREKVVSEEMAKMRKKPEKKPVSPSDVKKTQDVEEGKIGDQASLF